MTYLLNSTHPSFTLECNILISNIKLNINSLIYEHLYAWSETAIAIAIQEMIGKRAMCIESNHHTIHLNVKFNSIETFWAMSRVHLQLHAPRVHINDFSQF